MTRENQEKQFLELLYKHQNIIHKICHIYVLDTTDREDLFQEITLQAWKSFPTFRGQSQFSTWLYRVALNTAISFRKKERKQQFLISAETLPDIAATYDFTEEQFAALHKAISSLSDIEKALILLYMENLSYNDIGEILGISANNVAVKMNRIKTKLKEQTKKHYHL
jgi:RNA polymerase sigma-70 factor, ECF subfamily